MHALIKLKICIQSLLSQTAPSVSFLVSQKEFYGWRQVSKKLIATLAPAQAEIEAGLWLRLTKNHLSLFSSLVLASIISKVKFCMFVDIPGATCLSFLVRYTKWTFAVPLLQPCIILAFSEEKNLPVQRTCHLETPAAQTQQGSALVVFYGMIFSDILRYQY